MSAVEKDWEVEPEEVDGVPTAVLPGLHPQQSLLDSLRDERQAIAEERHLDVVVPGWHGKIGLRLGPIPPRDVQRMVEANRRSKSKEADTDLIADTLIAATRCVLGRSNEDDDFAPITSYDGQPVGLDAEFIDLLGLDVPRPTARAVLFALFAQANAPGLAITSLNGDYLDWVRSSDRDIDEEFRGEAPAAAR